MTLYYLILGHELFVSRGLYLVIGYRTGKKGKFKAVPLQAWTGP
jgi:hypothetical protein